MKISKSATVMLWGVKVGYVLFDEFSGITSFEYDKEFVKMGVELSPIKMPLSSRIYAFPELIRTSFKGTPGLLSDSLPDRFGNALIEQYLAKQGRTIDSFNVTERLCYLGSRGMGALEYKPNLSNVKDTDDAINVSRLAALASDILSEKENVQLTTREKLDYKQLLRLGTSAGGARAKAIVAHNESTGELRSGQINLAEGFEHWLLKFDGVSRNGDHNVEDAPEYTLIEYAYHKMALAAGINMNPCKILKVDGKNHFITKRFDRVSGKKLHMQSLGALLHIDYDIPGLCSYETAAMVAYQLKLPASDIEEFFRRMVFNVLAVNHDDHVKNISFLMDRKGVWSLSPAYDITFAFEPNHRWLSRHQMTINGKSENFSVDDLLACGSSMDLKKRQCMKIVNEVQTAVNRWPEFAKSEGIRPVTIEMIARILQENPYGNPTIY